jgi:hypothetical protein
MRSAAPWTVQGIADCLARWATIYLQAASIAPDPVNMPAAHGTGMAYRLLNPRILTARPRFRSG